ncbi:thioesterase II family protein [Microbispora sp. H13382]|uniref:thioesterase II family protein n=1 Tax=Microbispora sp. H13382 TaxID=2729112 RepID=UPI001C71BC2F|nr:alpha/beta fold hydrolase [Microbispora sp. H13382]
MSHTASRTTRAHGWIVGAAPRRPAPAIRLLCLPYAGGAASSYASWQNAFADDVEVCPVELPGRQTRWHERPFTRLEPLVEALASALAGELDVPYALFGHSMGALVAFELARELRRRGAAGPRVLFASGGAAPQLRRERPGIHDQPEDVVIARLRSMGGLPEEVIAEPELLELLVPAIRADFAVCETYAYRPEPPLTCPIFAFAGTEDQEVPAERVSPWQEQTSATFLHQVLPGGHFFLRTAQPALLNTVRTGLTAALARIHRGATPENAL